MTFRFASASAERPPVSANFHGDTRALSSVPYVNLKNVKTRNAFWCNGKIFDSCAGLHFSHSLTCVNFVFTVIQNVFACASLPNVARLVKTRL